MYKVAHTQTVLIKMFRPLKKIHFVTLIHLLFLLSKLNYFMEIKTIFWVICRWIFISVLLRGFSYRLPADFQSAFLTVIFFILSLLHFFWLAHSGMYFHFSFNQID
jgi:hypothetical protein